MAITETNLAEIAEQRNTQSPTRRVVSPGAESILYEPVKLLDHGFVRLVDYMGDDGAVVQAARTSYGKGTRKPTEDADLIRYLLRHRHSTPFEMCEAKFDMAMPLFCARQMVRHRTANINEYSARYSVMEREFYVPEPGQLAVQSSANRQGRGAVLDGDEAAKVLEILKADANGAFDSYEYMLNENPDGSVVDESRSGLARELARIGLPLSTYTRWYWKVDVHNLMNFLVLRADSHAQYEIRVYAKAMSEMLRVWMPWTHAAFVDYRMDAFSMSGRMMAALRLMIRDGTKPTREDSGMGKREWSEFTKAIGL